MKLFQSSSLILLLFSITLNLCAFTGEQQTQVERVFANNDIQLWNDFLGSRRANSESFEETRYIQFIIIQMQPTILGSSFNYLKSVVLADVSGYVGRTQDQKVFRDFLEMLENIASAYPSTLPILLTFSFDILDHATPGQ